MIELKEVSKQYRLDGDQTVQALDHVSLHVGERERISIVGSNGSGKSSLLKCISGMLEPDEGEVWVDGKPVSDMGGAERGQLVGIVFQNPTEGSVAHLTVEENLALGAMRGRRPWLRRLLGQATQTEIGRLAARVPGDLASRLRQRAGTLSGGQRQGLAIVAAVIGRPRILLLDEHTASLDPGASKSVLALTEEIAEEYGLIVLAVTHDLRAALGFGKRLLVLHRGKIALDVSEEQKRALSLDGLVGMLRASAQEDLATDAGLTLGGLAAGANEDAG